MEGTRGKLAQNKPSIGKLNMLNKLKTTNEINIIQQTCKIEGARTTQTRRLKEGYAKKKHRRKNAQIARTQTKALHKRNFRSNK